MVIVHSWHEEKKASFKWLKLLVDFSAYILLDKYGAKFTLGVLEYAAIKIEGKPHLRRHFGFWCYM